MYAFQIAPHILRCVWVEQPLRSAPLFAKALPSQPVPLPETPGMVRQVELQPRPVWKMQPQGDPHIKVMQTVDGQRTVIENLAPVFDRDAFRAVIHLSLDPGEHIWGFGQDEDGILDKRGQVVYLYQNNLRIPMPVFVSSKGYGIFADCGCRMVFDDRTSYTTLTLECVDQADLYVIRGSMDEIVAGLRLLTGRAAPLPDWALGYWQSRETYKTQQELLDVAAEYRRLDVPLDVVVQDWKTWTGQLWGEKQVDAERYPDLPSLKQQMHGMHVHTLVSVWPNMNSGGNDHLEFAQNGMLLNDYSTYNAHDPAARALYWQQAGRQLAGGFDGWWCDSTEPFCSPDWNGEHRRTELECYQLVGEEHEKYLDPAFANAYALEHAKGLWEHAPVLPVVNLTRAGWTGIQQYGAILWAGDTSASWQELRREIAKGLSISLCGIPYWTVDAGAFFTGSTACWRRWCGDPNAAPVWFWRGEYDDGVQDLGYQELYTRWLQFACFLPVFRSHGTDTPREVWNFSQPFRAAIEDTIRLRYRLLPYIKQLARRVVEEDFTILRSLAFDFPQDEQAVRTDDQFLFGQDILVCPVLHPVLYGPRSTPLQNASPVRRCWLPEGCGWCDFYTGRQYEGGCWVEVPVQLNRIPLFVRRGARITVQQGAQYAAEQRTTEYLIF